MKIFTRQKNKITIGDETFEPLSLDLEESIKLLLLLVPYVALLENYILDFQTALKDTSGKRPRLLFSLLQTLSTEIAPQDMTKAFAILLHKPPEWFRGVKAKELVQALPILDDINDFAEIFSLVREMGLTVKYGRTN